MLKFFFSFWLGIQLMCRRIELDPNLLLEMWQTQPAIEIYDPSPSVRRANLSARLDAVFPF